MKKEDVGSYSMEVNSMALAKAEIVILYRNGNEKEVIPVMFNPSEYKISKQVNYGNISVQSIESKMITYQNGEPKTLSIELFFDMDRGYEFMMENYDEGVRKYTEKIMGLTNCEEDGGPPLCKFKWGNLSFSGYVTSVDESFTRFNSQGIPIRAVINLSMIENYKDNSESKKDKLKNNNKNVVNNTEDLYNLLENPANWKEIAKKLGILNPRKII